LLEVSLLSYTLTPFATIASLEFTMLMPLAPLNTLPLTSTAPVLLEVTVELFAAIEESLAPAVILSNWLSRSACLVGLSFVGLGVFWPKAEPPTRTDAVTRVQANLFTSASWALLNVRIHLRSKAGCVGDNF